MKKKLLFAILFLGLIILFISCERDEANVKKSQAIEIADEQPLPLIRSLSYEEAGQKFEEIRGNLELEGYMDIIYGSEGGMSLRSSVDSMGVTIYTNVIKEVSKEDYISYTMFIDANQPDDTSFYNLTIEEKNSEPSMYVTKYTPTQAWLDDKNQAFIGEITTKRTSATELINQFEDDSQLNSGGYVSNPADCDGYVIQTTVINEIPCSCGDSWLDYLNGNCDGCTGAVNVYPSLTTETVYECVVVDTVDPNAGSDPNSQSNGTGNSGDLPNDEDDPYTDEEEESFSGIITKDEVTNVEEECDVDIDFYDRINALENSQDVVDIFDYLAENNNSCEASAFVYLALDALENEGEVDWDDAIILDETMISNQKLKCIYDNLKSLSNTFFKDVIQSQFGSSNTNHIKIEIGNLPAQINSNSAFTYTTYVNGSTVSFEQGNPKYIRFDANYIQGASTIDIARALIHELIHAELMDRCIKLGLVQEIGLLGETQLISNPVIETLPQAIFNQLLLQYNAYEPPSSPNVNPQWNHDLFNALNYRIDLAQDLVLLHSLLNDPNNDFLTSVNNDPNIVGGPYTISQIMDYKAWAGLEGTTDYANTISNIPTELAKMNYLDSMFSTQYNHNCN